LCARDMLRLNGLVVWRVDVRNHPILVHCTKGTVRIAVLGLLGEEHERLMFGLMLVLQHRTGCVIGCMRKMENWSLTSIIDEYCRFAGPRMRLLDQQFIEFFTPTIRYDARQMPRWLSLA
jgi:tyrosine-protein phosphatase SIW14